MSDHYIEAAYALIVAGAAMVQPWLALIVAGAFFGLLVYLEWRSPKPEAQS